jgi:hypothetical protein
VIKFLKHSVLLQILDKGKVQKPSNEFTGCAVDDTKGKTIRTNVRDSVVCC